MSSLATEQAEYKLLRFKDTGYYNRQQYKYNDDGTLEGDEGEQWILFKGRVENHGEEGEHIHVPPQTALKWSRLPYNHQYQTDDGVDIARFTDKVPTALPECKIYKDNPDPNPPPPGVDPWDYLPVYDPNVQPSTNEAPDETYDLDWTRVVGVKACKDFFHYPYNYENKVRILDENPEENVEEAEDTGMKIDDPKLKKLPLRF